MTIIYESYRFRTGIFPIDALQVFFKHKKNDPAECAEPSLFNFFLFALHFLSNKLHDVSQAIMQIAFMARYFTHEEMNDSPIVERLQKFFRLV